MKYLISLLLLVSLLVQHSNAYRTTIVSEGKRQVPDSICSLAYLNLSPKEQRCFDTGDSTDDGSSDDSLSPTALGDIVCDSEFCMDVAKRLLAVCKSYFQDYLPDDYKGLNTSSLVNLLCENDFSGVPCYEQLPLDTDVLLSCQSALKGGTCSRDCINVLIRYNTTCCFATLLSMQPNTGSIHPSQLWNICGVGGSHTLCNVKTSSNSGLDGNGSDGNNNDNNNTIYIIAAAGGGLFILLVIVVITIVMIIAIKKCSKSRLSMNSGDMMRMSLANNECDDEDDDS